MIQACVGHPRGAPRLGPVSNPGGNPIRIGTDQGGGSRLVESCRATSLSRACEVKGDVDPMTPSLVRSRGRGHEEVISI